MKYPNIKVIGIITITSVMLSGCKASGLSEEYSYETRTQNFHTEEVSNTSLPLFASSLCVIDQNAQNMDSAVTAEAGALFNVTDGSVLYSKNAHERLYPASTTKVMTAILALEEGNLSDFVTVTDASVITESGASLAGIKPGDVFTMEQLLYGLMMPSGNDAANAIAVHMYGSLDAFVERMNERAVELGATKTHFTNPSGLNNENHYTSAYDLYLMFNEALKIPKFKEIIESSSYTADYMNAAGESLHKTWTTGNLYQKGDAKTPDGLTVIGGKTGTTQAAGYCLIMASADSAGKEYISVVLKAANRSDLYGNMSELISKIAN